ncbi:MAG: GNAT family N-acetyltransferase [Kordiimonadaceae bacterium]|nr:GNAT family N-acetyltransferase [Kordiimonadaceae bacterium]
MKDFLPLKSDRLIVRQFCMADAEAFLSWRDDADVARYTLWKYPYTIEQSRAFCAEMAAIDRLPDGAWVQLMVEERASGRAIGDVGLGIKIDGANSVKVGYSLHRDAWGKGFMTEVLKLVLPAVASAAGVERLEAEIDIRNMASGTVLEKIGFKRGPLKKKAAFVKGEWCDEYEYVLDAADLLGGAL